MISSSRAGRSEAFQRLAQRTEGLLRPALDRAARQHEQAAVARPLQRLVRQPRLADPCLTDQGDRTADARGGLGDGGFDLRQLGRAADQLAAEQLLHPDSVVPPAARGNARGRGHQPRWCSRHCRMAAVSIWRGSETGTTVER